MAFLYICSVVFDMSECSMHSYRINGQPYITLPYITLAFHAIQSSCICSVLQQDLHNVVYRTQPPLNYPTLKMYTFGNYEKKIECKKKNNQCPQIRKFHLKIFRMFRKNYTPHPSQPPPDPFLFPSPSPQLNSFLLKEGPTVKCKPW